VGILGDAGEQMRFDGTIENHLHIICIHCGKIVDLPAASVADLGKKAQDCTDFQIIDFKIEFKGICPECSGKGQCK